MRRVAGGLALLLVLSGCTSEGAPTTTSTTAAPTTTSSAPPTSTTTAPPETTTTIAVTACGDYLQVQSIPWPAPADKTKAGAHLPRIVGFDHHSQADINARLEAFVAERLATYSPDEGAYSLDFTALCLERDSWAMLSFVFTERITPDGDSGGTDLRFALPFDLVRGDLLAAADMFSDAGVAGLRALVSARLGEVLGEGFCCLTPDALVADLAVVPEGLLVYLDEADGVPHEVGPLEFLLAWSELAPLLDLGQPYLASFAVAQGFCSTSGQEWVLEDQPGLPAPVAAKRAAIFAAAAACDYEALEDLAEFPQEIRDSVIGHPGTAAAWRHEESEGYAPLRRLAETLNLQYAERTYSNPDAGYEWQRYVWPLAFGTDPSEIPSEHWAELAEVLSEESLAFIRENGFLGLRLGILDDGTWGFVAAGD